jgi:hypothetical protein
MRVWVRQHGGSLVAELLDAEKFDSFAVQLDSAIELDACEMELAGIVRFASEEQAWVSQEWLRGAGGYLAGSAAGSAFEAMVSAAARHGWIDPDSGDVAAHIERVERAPDIGGVT